MSLLYEDFGNTPESLVVGNSCGWNSLALAGWKARPDRKNGQGDDFWDPPRKAQSKGFRI